LRFPTRYLSENCRYLAMEWGMEAEVPPESRQLMEPL